MAGFREFQTGEVLTAANVDDFLMKQSVQKYADAAARDSALGTAVGGGNALREGMVAYLDDEDLPSFYNGTTWTTEFGGGGLVAVKHALFTGTQTNSTAAGANFAVDDLSITHTLADAANKLIISAYFGAAGSSEQLGQVGIAVADDGTLIAIGDADGVRTRVGAGGVVSGTGSTIVVTMPSVTFVYEPGDTASHTYTVRAINIRTDTRTLYINRTEEDLNFESRSRASSGFVIQEVKV
jgi:hypothetical protein